jgi:hypothetical protein
MKEHIDILELLDFAKGKIKDEDMNEYIIDHLTECDQCLRILKAHFFLLNNKSKLIESFFSDLEAVSIKSKNTIEPDIIDFQSNFSSRIKKFSGQILKMIDEAQPSVEEVKNKVRKWFEDLKSLTDTQERLIPVIVEKPSVFFLGPEEGEMEIEHGLKSGILFFRFIYFHDSHLTPENLSFEYTGKFLYITYSDKDYTDMIGEKVKAITCDVYPCLFEAKFNEGFNNAIAKFELEFGELILNKGEDESMGRIEIKFIVDIN